MRHRTTQRTFIRVVTVRYLFQKTVVIIVYSQLSNFPRLETHSKGGEFCVYVGLLQNGNVFESDKHCALEK